MKNSVQLIGKCSNISNCEYAIRYDDVDLGLFSTNCVFNESGYCTNEDAIIDKILEKIAIQKIQKM